MKLEGQSQDCSFLCFIREEFVKARMSRKDGIFMKESYAENEEVFADIVISGRIFDCSGRQLSDHVR